MLIHNFAAAFDTWLPHYVVKRNYTPTSEKEITPRQIRQVYNDSVFVLTGRGMKLHTNIVLTAYY